MPNNVEARNHFSTCPAPPSTSIPSSLERPTTELRDESRRSHDPSRDPFRRQGAPRAERPRSWHRTLVQPTSHRRRVVQTRRQRGSGLSDGRRGDLCHGGPEGSGRLLAAGSQDRGRVATWRRSGLSRDLFGCEGHRERVPRHGGVPFHTRPARRMVRVGRQGDHVLNARSCRARSFCSRAQRSARTAQLLSPSKRATLRWTKRRPFDHCRSVRAKRHVSTRPTRPDDVSGPGPDHEVSISLHDC